MLEHEPWTLVTTLTSTWTPRPEHSASSPSLHPATFLHLQYPPDFLLPLIPQFCNHSQSLLTTLYCLLTTVRVNANSSSPTKWLQLYFCACILGYFSVKWETIVVINTGMAALLHENNTDKQIAWTIASSYSAKVKNPGQFQKENFSLELHLFDLSFQYTDGHLTH